MDPTHTAPTGQPALNGNPVAPQAQQLLAPQPTSPVNYVPPLAEPGANQLFTSSQVADVVSRERQAQYTDLASSRAATAQALAQAERAEAEAATLRAAQAANANVSADEIQLRQISELTQEMTALREQHTAMEADRQQREHSAAMNSYRSQRLVELRQSNVNVVEALVAGDSPEAIEASIQVANAEYGVLQQAWQAAQPAPPAPTAYAQVPAPVQQAPTQQVLTTVNPAPVPQQGFTAQSLQQMTSADAVRDGSYQKNRELILAQLRQGPARTQAQMPMRPFAQAEQVPVQPYAQPAPVQQAYAPQAPVQQVYAPPAPAQQAYAPQAPVQQAYAPPPGLAEAKALAAESAHNALTNPQQAAASAETIGSLGVAPGYGFATHNPNAPSAHQLGNGVHPQFRNS